MAGAIRGMDVAAIISVLFVLVVMAIYAASHLQERALRAQCRGNLRQLGLALQLYAKDSKGLLPDCSPSNPELAGPTWPWDMSTNLSNLLMAKSVIRPMFYCPANPQMNDDRHWNFWRQVPGQVRVMGYGFTFKGTRQIPQNLWRTDLSGNGASPANAELGFDATASVNNDFTAITGIWVDRSNHVRKDKTPCGGNVLFVDGHVEWRDFSVMEPRFNTIGPAGPVSWCF